jgi:hypothetical protein
LSQFEFGYCFTPTDTEAKDGLVWFGNCFTPTDTEAKETAKVKGSGAFSVDQGMGFSDITSLGFSTSVYQ